MSLPTQLSDFFSKISDLDSDSYMKLASQYLDDDTIEVMANHVAEFYGLNDDEEIGGLTQVMVTGFIAGRATQAN